MKRPIRAYIAYAIFSIRHWIDNFLWFCLGQRLHSMTLESFVERLTPDQRNELQDPDIRDPVVLNLKCFNQDTALSDFSRYVHLRQMREHLTYRVKHKAALIKNPDLLNTPIRKPIFIIGLPRTGTTLLYNIMAYDPRFRAPMMWELMEPFPPGPVRNWTTNPRYTKLCHTLEMHKYLGNYDFDHAHYMRPHLPEECYLLLQSLLRVSPGGELRDWFYSRRQGYKLRLYNFYKQQLQVLGYGHGMEKRHFLLKSHIHLLGLEALLATFPDAGLVFTYRKLSDVIPSFCSLMEAATGYYSKTLNAEFSEQCVHLLGNLCNNAASSFSKLIPEGTTRSKNLMLINYTDLLNDTAGTVKDIYEHFDIPFDGEDLKETVRKHLVENPKGKHGKHVYTMEQYRITKEEIYKECQTYVDFMSKFMKSVV